MKKTMRSRLFVSVLLPLAALLAPSDLLAQRLLSPGDRVAIIGDSITEQKLYTKYMEAYLLACSGVPDLRVFQFGWSGETAAGFDNRLKNDLAVFKPTVATTCYGMNDGAYRPYTDQIGRNYENAMRKVIAGLREIGVKKIVAGSPGAVDTTFFRNNNFAPISAADGYNQSLAKLGEIDQKLAGEMDVIYADVHTPMIQAMAKAKAQLGADYDVCGRDGVHPRPNGHLIMAAAFLRALGCDGQVADVVVDMQGPPTASAGHKVLAQTPAEAELESSRYPFCFDGDPKNPDGTRSILPFFPFNQDLNRFTLKVKHLAAPKARVTWGAESKEFTQAQLGAGINLAAEFDQTPFSAQFEKILQAVAAKQQFETMMIKTLVTNFRYFENDAQAEPKLASAFKDLSQGLMARQQELEGSVRASIVPIRHTISVTPL